MEKTSKQVQIRRGADEVYRIFADLRNFDALADRLDDWQATEDQCSFKTKGFTVNLKITEREKGKMVKYEGEVPVEFALWMQLVEAGECDTRMRLVLRAKLNPMMKMMVGGALEKGLDQAAEQVATMLNMGR